MTPEEYQRVKEAEKEHLRALKRLKKAVRQLERSKSIAQSVTRMTAGSENVLDTHREMVDKLAMETAHYEAKLEVALESASDRAERAEREEALAKADEDLQRARARDLIDQIRSELQAGAEEAPAAPDVEDRTTSKEPPPGDSEGEDKPMPEKTIGRMRRP